MAKEHQPKSSKSYILPHNLYYIVLYTIRDYDRMKAEYKEAGELSAHKISGTISGGIGSPTEYRGIKRANLFDKLEAIENALLQIPSEYRKGLMHNIIYKAWYPNDAGMSTYRRWKQRLIYYVAENLGYI